MTRSIAGQDDSFFVHQGKELPCRGKTVKKNRKR